MSALAKAARLVRVEALKYYRVVGANYPRINLTENVADPADWDSIATAMAKEDSTFSRAASNLLNVPTGRRVGGPGSSWVMVPFVYNSPDYPRVLEH